MGITTTMRKTLTVSERRRRFQRRRRCTAFSGESSGNGGLKRSSNSKVSDKLEALKSLIPSREGETLQADQLFDQTANYIVRLRAQVAVLQTLIEFYGSGESDNVVVS